MNALHMLDIKEHNGQVRVFSLLIDFLTGGKLLSMY